jgi:tetratricopeptide (TPR) repeat protein
MKKFLLLALLLIIPVITSADESIDSLIIFLKKEQKEALNNADLTKFNDVANKFERLSTFKEKEWLINYYLAYNYYRMSSITQDKEESKKFINESKKYIQKSLELKDDFVEARALYSSILGFEISLKPQLTVTNGIKSIQEIDKASKLEDNNPRVCLIDGMITLNKPSIFGGGADNAIAKFRNAIELFETEPEDMGIYPDWGMDEAYIWLGMSYEQKEEKSEALEYYRKALEENPDNSWAKAMIKNIEE